MPEYEVKYATPAGDGTNRWAAVRKSATHGTEIEIFDTFEEAQSYLKKDRHEEPTN